MSRKILCVAGSGPSVYKYATEMGLHHPREHDEEEVCRQPDIAGKDSPADTEIVFEGIWLS